MKERKELPLFLNPPYKTYGYLWFEDGIIMGNFKNAIPWILSNNIHIGFANKQLKVYNRESSFIDQGPLIVQKKSFYYQDVMVNPDKIIKMIEGFVDSGYYVEGYWNEIAIKEKPAYQKYDFHHNYYIYGYDCINREFISVGYTNLGTVNSFSQIRF